MKRLGVLIVTIVAGLAFMAVPAGANHITGVAATCDHVTVTWSAFPTPPVTIHIGVSVGAVGITSADVSATPAAGSATVSISSLTALLNGSTATVTVTSTWTIGETPHSATGTASVTCGEVETTTTTAPSTTTTTPATTTVSSTTTAPTTTMPPPISSTTVSPTTIVITTTTTGPTTTTTTPQPGPPLPHTGTSPGPLVGLGSVLLGGGLALVRMGRRRWLTR